MSCTQQILASLMLVMVVSFTATSSYGQIAVNSNPPNTNAQHLVQNVLLGPGVAASSITSTGGASQFGVFQAISAISPIGIDSGVVMSSGNATDVTPFGNPAAFGGFGGGDADLVAVASSVNPGITAGFDAALLEFDFIPTSDTVTFRYVFGSEEYLTWIGSVFNDAFGFFISGPGINGPYANNAENIAIIPNTTTPITISTVQPALNSQYYINNPNNVGTSLNGFTTVLTAVAVVQACQTYHIKLAVSDCTDDWLDSAVFLEAGSFSFSGVTIAAAPSLPAVNGGDSTVYEGCGDVIYTFQRNAGLQDTVYVPLDISGTAIPGVDYVPLPDTLVFLPGQSQINLNIQAFDDGLAEALETLIISVGDSSCLGGVSSSTMYISDPLDIGATTTDISISCATGPGTIEVFASGGIAPYSYTWSNGATNNSQVVDPPQTTTFYVTVTDACGTRTAEDSVVVTRIDQPLLIEFHNDTIDCTVDSVEIGVNVISGFSPYLFVWDTGDSTATIWVDPFQTTDYTVSVSDACGMGTQVAIIRVVVIERVIGATVDSYEINCPGDSVFIGVVPSGGIAPLTYWWDSGVQNMGQMVSPQYTTDFAVHISDVCGLDTTTVLVHVEVEQHSPLQLEVSEDVTVMCSQDKANLTGLVTEGAGGYRITWDGWATVLDNPSSTVSRFPAVTTTFICEATDECAQDTVRGSVEVAIQEFPPLEVAMPETFILCPGEGAELLVNATGGTGVYDYKWEGYPFLNGDRFFVGPEFNEVFRVRVTDECGAQDWGATAVYYLQPTARFDFLVEDDANVQFENQSSEDAVSFLWEFSNGATSVDENPLHQISFEDGDQLVTLWVENEFGCTDSASAVIEPPVMIFVPNSFTPDGDGLNDVFTVHGIGLQDYEMWVFNRWGEQIFYSNSIDKQWNGRSGGRNVPTGTYVYKILAKGHDQRAIDKSGAITVLYH